jgi:hypothetical protein
MALVTASPLLLAVAGVVHPSALNGSTAHHWAVLHIALLPVFPLVAVGFILPMWGRPRNLLTVLVWAAAFGYACFYTGLDAVAGIAAGTLVERSPQPIDRDLLVIPLYQVGDKLGHVGAYAFVVAALMVCIALYPRHGMRVLPGGVVLVSAGWSFLDSHIFWPRGVVTMLGFAVGFALLVWATEVDRRVPTER